MFTAPLLSDGRRHGSPKPRTYIVIVDDPDTGESFKWSRPLRLQQAVRLQHRLQRSAHLRGTAVSIGSIR